MSLRLISNLLHCMVDKLDWIGLSFVLQLTGICKKYKEKSNYLDILTYTDVAPSKSIRISGVLLYLNGGPR